MLRTDLDPFQAQLVHSLDGANWPCEVRLASTDPGVDLLFRVERTGRITGAYQFGGDDRLFSGAFTMDQTYVGPLLAQMNNYRLKAGRFGENRGSGLKSFAHDFVT